MSRITKDEYYLGIALAVSKRSTCIKRHYGAVIVKDDVVVSTGYNGSPRKTPNCCDHNMCARANCNRYEGYENCPSVHAEQNAILACDRSKMIGATLYLACEDNDGVEDTGLNVMPCNLCRNMILNAGITRVVTKGGGDLWV